MWLIDVKLKKTRNPTIAAIIVVGTINRQRRFAICLARGLRKDWAEDTPLNIT